jgi:hypothetical protein
MLRLSIVILASALCATQAEAQLRRQGSGPPAEARPVIPADPRHPYVGTWIGTMNIVEPMPLMFEFQISDGKYDGGTVWPGGGKAPHRNVRVVNDQLLWEMPNNGGGTWHYVAKRVSADSIVGTVVLKDYELPPDLPGKGSFVVVRRAAPAK